MPFRAKFYNKLNTTCEVYFKLVTFIASLGIEKKKNGSSILSKKISIILAQGCVALTTIDKDFWPGFSTG